MDFIVGLNIIFVCLDFNFYSLNYLAHIFLSGADRQVQIGNFIGDAVKGHAYDAYPDKIREGILLHRKIDDFSDKHPLVKEAVALLRSDFGRYSAVLVDMYFDYFLAVDFNCYSSVPLRRFASRLYVAAVFSYFRLPARIRRFLWHFILTNRLCRYASKKGLQESLEIMAVYKNLQVSPLAAISFLTAHEEELHDLFRRFFPELMAECRVRGLSANVV